MPLDYTEARRLLESEFPEIEASILRGGEPPSVASDLSRAFDVIFTSSTLAFREALLGCVLARIQDREVNLRLPYVGHGAGAFQGRELDQQSVNPFLQDHRIPSTKGPYLSKFRRSVRFDKSLRIGTRDTDACDSFLHCEEQLRQTDDDQELLRILRNMLYRFAVARETSMVPLNRIQRFNVHQYAELVTRLLRAKSGGRFALFIVVATLRALADAIDATWEIEWQEINVADSPSGAAGDVTVRSGSDVIIVAEVTERQVDRPRLVATFNSKIGPAGMKDYLFFTTTEPPEETQTQAYQYFAQGHEVSFLDIAEWTENILGTIGQHGRQVFNSELIALLDDVRVPQAVKAAWNQAVDLIVAR